MSEAGTCKNTITQSFLYLMSINVATLSHNCYFVLHILFDKATKIGKYYFDYYYCC